MEVTIRLRRMGIGSEVENKFVRDLLLEEFSCRDMGSDVFSCSALLTRPFLDWLEEKARGTQL